MKPLVQAICSSRVCLIVRDGYTRSKLISRWMNMTLYSAFETWHVNAQAKRRAENVCTRIICRYFFAGKWVAMLCIESEVVVRVHIVRHQFSAHLCPCCCAGCSTSAFLKLSLLGKPTQLVCSLEFLHVIICSLPLAWTCSTFVCFPLRLLLVGFHRRRVRCLTRGDLVYCFNRDAARGDRNEQSHNALAQPDAVARVRHMERTLEQAAPHVSHRLQVMSPSLALPGAHNHPCTPKRSSNQRAGETHLINLL